MPRAVGIDLGTTNSVIAAVSGGRPTVVPNAVGARTTPSVVAFTEAGARLVGDAARRQAVLNPKGTIHSAKRFTGRRYDEVGREAAGVLFDVIGDGGMARFDIKGRRYAPEEISALVLRSLVDDAAAVLGERIDQAVVTVPAHFDDAQRTATREAGRLAGLRILRIINEPTAAAVAYGLHLREPQTVLVVDLGGGTFDVSVLDVGDGTVEVRAAAGDAHLGGDDFDHRVVEHLVAGFHRDHGIDLAMDAQTRQRLTEAAQRAKEELSSATEAEVNLPFVASDPGEPKHLRTLVDRHCFDELTADLVERCRGPVEQAMRDAQVRAADLDQVLMVGGATRIPAVRELLRRLTDGHEPHLLINADEVVALGAAVQAGLLTGAGADADTRTRLRDVTSLAVGLQAHDGAMATIIERNTAIPVRRTQIFSTAEDDQVSVDIVVRQGQRSQAQDNRILGRFRLSGIRPAPRGTPRIEVTAETDADGIVTISARDADSGHSRSITVTEIVEPSSVPAGPLPAAGPSPRGGLPQRPAGDAAGVDPGDELQMLAELVERELAGPAAVAPAHERTRAQMLVDDAHGALGEQAPVERLRTLSAELRQVAEAFAAASDHR
ncbi:molecular chaperone DnaK [Micromonospora sp. NBC_01813]|uniref:molecular chaperone DnaK n=1 Tax=Micromonospora sp. NBC_01813 TaxID=2975988 RepID=UPI002DD8CC33|nr:molecular chaperone DnaK [Micromonospora sp. NBC_01813]WSA10634.1 molecular chaperone DnaK [Micromonospora sp. NBC_01813]